MNNLKINLRKRDSNRSAQLNAVNTHIQPFKEMPSVSELGNVGSTRMTAHDLFSHYTADVIKEDIIYAR